MKKKIFLLVLFLGTFLLSQLFGENFSKVDDFNSLDKNFWLVYDHGGYSISPTPANYGLVNIDSGILKMPVQTTDHGPELISKGIKISPSSIITVEWKVKVHYENEYFTGGVTFWLYPYESFYDPVKGDSITPFQYYDKTQDKVTQKSLAVVKYNNYFYGNSDSNPLYGETFGICGYKKCIKSTPIWDKWFTNKVIISIPDKVAKFYQDGQYIGEVPINPDIDLQKTPYIKIHFSPYGWFTGHEMDLDYVKINISDSSTTSPTNPTNCSTINCATFDFPTMTLNVPCLSYDGKNYKLKLKLVQTNPQILFALTGIEPASPCSSSNTQSTSSSLKTVTLSTTNNYQINFSTGKLGSTNNPIKDYDISLEPWCTEKPGVCGNFVDLGNVDINGNIQIPKSGYLSDEAGFEDCIEIDTTHTFINKNRDGSYTVFRILKHEKPSQCDHTLVIEYRNIK